MYGPSIIGSLRRILTPYFFQGTAEVKEVIMALKRMRPKKMENDFVIDEFLDNTSNKLPFPTHMVILGPTQSIER